MRLRALVAATVATAFATAGLVGLPQAPAAAVSQNCGWTGNATSDPTTGAEGLISAGPLLEPGATQTWVTCEARRWSPDGPVIGGHVQITPGPVGVMAVRTVLDPVARGDEVYLCTWTRADSGPWHFRACDLAFTA